MSPESAIAKGAIHRCACRYDVTLEIAFGGGSEVLEAGHDEGNVWALLNDGMLYVVIC